MLRNNYNDLLAFIAVAQEQSFTRAAARLGVSQSALSHTIRALEAKMDVRLLTRTTRSVSPTEAGERLLQTVAPRLQEIRDELAAVGELRDKPAGTVRITASEYAAKTVIWPKLVKLLPNYPEINVEVNVESRFTDIVPERYDIGIRLGDGLAKDMTAMRISPDMPAMIVCSPAYLAGRPAPQKPQDLTCHNCINLRLMSHGELYPWELKKGKQQVNVRVDGQLVFNRTEQILDAALAGLGLGYVWKEMAQPHIAKGHLISVLDDWCPVFTGYHLYYPSGRKPSRAMQILINALSYPVGGAHGTREFQ